MSFALSYLINGELHKYKARFVARGVYSRMKSTISPVVGHDTIRGVIAAVFQCSWRHRQLDVETAFLNSALNENAFVKQPFNSADTKVWNLKKAVYGLKQASHSWYDTVAKVLVKRGYIQCKSDPCVSYMRKHHRAVVILYVDDMYTFSDDYLVLDDLQSDITRVFRIRTCDEVNSFVGMEIKWKRSGDPVPISQGKYIRSLVERFGGGSVKARRSPMDEDYRKQLQADENVIDKSIRPVIGSLLNASKVSQPDLATAVRILAQRTERLTNTVMNGINHLLW